MLSRIINLDALTYAGSLENLANLHDPERHIFIQGDICDLALVSRLIEQYQVDAIIHFAAETHVDRSILGPQDFIRTNILGTFSLLEAAKEQLKSHPSKESLHFHHVSTDEVFGSLSEEEPPFSESTPYAPNSPYAASKAASDHLVRAYGHTYGIRFTITNCSNNYGPHQFPEKLIPLMILNALKGEPLPVYGDGKQVRDWLYVEDHCAAIWEVVGRSEPGQTYNIGGGNQPTNLEIIHLLCNLLDEMLPESPYTPHLQLIQFVQDRPGHDRRYAMDITRISNRLGWQPVESLESGLRKTIAWYISHPEWVKAVRQQQSYQGWLEKNYTQRTRSSFFEG